jgi:FdhD protein
MTEYMLQKTRAVVEETEIALFINDLEFNRFSCTPEALEELCIGHLFCRGLIESPGQVNSIQIKGESCELAIHAALDTNAEAKDPGPDHAGPVRLPEIEELQPLMNLLFDGAEKYKCHGGLHCSALYDGTRFVSHFEDVGRHNALDKVVGRALMDGLDPGRLIYFTSGRVNSEIAAKAVICGFPLIVSRSITTTRACRIAEEANIGIIGRAASGQPLLFNAPGNHA